MWLWLFFKGLSVRVSLFLLHVYVPSACSQSVVSLLVANWLVANSPAFAMPPGMPSSAFLPGCLWPPRRPHVPGDLQKQCFPPILSPLPPKKQTQPLPRALGTCNEKQVSPGDLSFLHSSLGVTTWGQGRGVAAGHTLHVQLLESSLRDSSHFLS